MRIQRWPTICSVSGVIALIILNTSAWAQTLPANYHPLAKGNVWVYYITHPWGNNSYKRLEITGDSIINGKSYRIVAQTNMDGSNPRPASLERFDSATGCYFIQAGGGETLQDSTFTSVQHASFGMRGNTRIFMRQLTQQQFGVQYPTREITEGDLLKEDQITWIYADGLGLIHADDLQLTPLIPAWVQTLEYAKIDGKEYGQLPLTNEIAYPLHVGDRWTFRGLTFMNPVPSIEVVKDTVMANSLKYAMVRYGNSTEIEYQRYHADSVFSYNPTQRTESLKYRFDAREKDTVRTSPWGTSYIDIILVDTSIITIFGKRLRTFTFSNRPRGTIDATTWVTIADSIGVIDIVQGAGYESILSGAFIDGTAYGTFISLQQSYYPMAVGNKWNFDTVSQHWSVKVIGDTLFPNGRLYRVLSQPDFAHGKYVRADAHFIYYYDQIGLKDVPFFHLDGQVGEKTEFSNGCNYISRSRILKIDSVVIFGEKTRCIQYRLDEAVTQRDITLSEKFGLIYAGLYSDPPPPWADYTYNAVGCIIDGSVYGTVTSIRNTQTFPGEYRLSQNYPNPFNPSTTIAFSIPTKAFVTLKVFDALGREVSSLVSEVLQPGSYTSQWNALGFASGVYFYRLQAGGYAETKRLMLIR